MRRLEWASFRIALVMGATACLSACVVIPTLAVYNPDASSVASSELARIYTAQIENGESAIMPALRSRIRRVLDDEGDPLDLGGLRVPLELKELHVPPGNYSIEALCYRGDRYAHIRLDIGVAAGREYVLVCISDKQSVSWGWKTGDSTYAAVLYPIERFGEVRFGMINRGEVPD